MKPGPQTHHAEFQAVLDLLHFSQSLLDHLPEFFHGIFNLDLIQLNRYSIYSLHVSHRTDLVFCVLIQAFCPPYLPAPALIRYGDCLMVFVLRLGAELAHTPLLIPAEHLQQSLMLLAHSFGKVVHRSNQPVKLQGGDSLMRLQVGFAV